MKSATIAGILALLLVMQLPIFFFGWDELQTAGKAIIIFEMGLMVTALALVAAWMPER